MKTDAATNAGTGRFAAETVRGLVEIGLADSIPAWLELRTDARTLREARSGGSAPERGEHAVERRARTAAGEITIRLSLESAELLTGKDGARR